MGGMGGGSSLLSDLKDPCRTNAPSVADVIGDQHQGFIRSANFKRSDLSNCEEFGKHECLIGC
ncbi:hypothetical protein CFREI_07255 [Corynebacterium freiburgense]|nr:hypothetical protein CFREI_07255 [Corynebacterium freiburgense]